MINTNVRILAGGGATCNANTSAGSGAAPAASEAPSPSRRDTRACTPVPSPMVRLARTKKVNEPRPTEPWAAAILSLDKPYLSIVHLHGQGATVTADWKIGDVAPELRQLHSVATL